MLVTCYVLLAKKSGTVPQMIPNFKGGFRGGSRGRGGRGHPFFFEILYYCYRIVRKIKSISSADVHDVEYLSNAFIEWMFL